MGLIHMNGRIYDALLGRFLQADPMVEDATTLNRYTYVHNNPLSYTDPSGYFSFKKAFRTIVSIAVGVAAGIATQNYGFTVKGFLTAVTGGAVSGAVAAGSVEGALWGAFSGAVFFGIGAGFDNLAQANLKAVESGKLSASKLVFDTNLKAGQFAAQSVSHGLAGGTISKMQGGRFGHGFFSAGISKAVTPGITGSPLNTYQQGFALAIVGGTTSKISGGKFANGAVTAAMAFAFNQAITSEERRNRARELLLGEDETIDILTPSLMRKRLGLLGELFLDRANAVGQMSAEEFASYMNRTYTSSEEDLWGGYRDQHSVVLRRHGYALSSGSLNRRLDALVVSAAEFGLTNIAGSVLRKSGARLVSSVSPNSPQDPILRSSMNKTPILRSVDMNVYEIEWR